MHSQLAGKERVTTSPPRGTGGLVDPLWLETAPCWEGVFWEICCNNAMPMFKLRTNIEHAKQNSTWSLTNSKLTKFESYEAALVRRAELAASAALTRDVSLHASQRSQGVCSTKNGSYMNELQKLQHYEQPGFLTTPAERNSQLQKRRHPHPCSDWRTSFALMSQISHATALASVWASS